MERVVGVIGHVNELDSEREDWIVYCEKLEQYFEANAVSENTKKAAVLLSLIGTSTYKLLRDLTFPEIPKQKSYDQLKQLLQKQFSPHVSIYRERINFFEAKQHEGEPCKEWYARIRSLAVNCKFKGNLEFVLKNKFVCGLKKGRVLDRLCEESEEKTIRDIVELAAMKEDSVRVREGELPGSDVVTSIGWQANQISSVPELRDPIFPYPIFFFYLLPLL